MKRRKSRREKDSRAKGRLRAKILAAKREREREEEKEPLASQKSPPPPPPPPPPRFWTPFDPIVLLHGPWDPLRSPQRGKGGRGRRGPCSRGSGRGVQKNPFASKDHLPSLFIHLRGGGLPFFYSSFVASVSLAEIRGGGRGKEDHHSKQRQEKRMGDKQNFQKQSFILSKC